MRRTLMTIAFVASCAHVPGASTDGVPSPWPAARADAGGTQATPPPATAPGRLTPTPHGAAGHAPPVVTTPGGAVIKRGAPPPVVPLEKPGANPTPSPPASHDPVDRAQPPAAGPTPALELPKPVRRKLKNGAALLVVERHQLPLASIVIAWPTGIADEPIAQAGLAGLTADLLDEGAGDRDPLQLADDIARLGAHVDAGVSWDATQITATTLTRALDSLLPIVADIAGKPRFDDKEVARVRADRLTALVQQRDSARQVAGDTVSRLVYGDRHRYGLPQLGTETALAGLSRADVVKWHHERLRPDQATVIVVGDVTPDDIARRLDSAFAGWTATGKFVAHHPANPALPAARRVVVVDRPDAQQTEMVLAAPGPPRKSKDYFASLVLDGILGGEFVSRLNLNLREKHGYTYGAHTGFAFRRDGGPFYAASPVKTAVTEPALKETLAELGRIRSSDVTAEELRLTKDLLERALARDFESPGQVASALVAQVVEGLPDDYYTTYAERIEKVSIADVRRAAQRWVDPAKMAIVLVGDESQIGAGVKGLVGSYERRGTDGAPLAQKP